MRLQRKFMVVLFLLLMGLVFNVQAAEPLPDTGQTRCYDADGNVLDPCPAPGEAFYGQDAQYNTAARQHSYTKLDANGNDLQDTATNWVMVRDNVTGLIWEAKNARDGVKDYNNPNDADNTYTWFDSNPATNGGDAGTPGDGTDTEDFINALNAASFGGHSDWRLPTVKELACLTDSGRYSPAIDIAYFPQTVSSMYWSSTTGASSTGHAWRVGFYYGDVYDYGKTYNYHCYVRAVRSGQ